MEPSCHVDQFRGGAGQDPRACRGAASSADPSALVLVFGVTAGIYVRLNKAGTTVVTNGLYAGGPTHGVTRWHHPAHEGVDVPGLLLDQFDHSRGTA